MKKPLVHLTGALVLLAASQAWAQAAAPASVGHAGHHPAAGAAAAPAPAAGPAPAGTSAPMAEGEIRRIDKAAGKITLRHGEIASLQMPPMTMVFVAADPTMLDRVKVGDKVRFRADQQGGAYRVIDLQPAD